MMVKWREKSNKIDTTSKYKNKKATIDNITFDRGVIIC